MNVETAMKKMKQLELETTSDSEEIHEENSTVQEIPQCRPITSITEKNKYILQLTATLETEPNVAYALSDHSCVVCSLSNQQICKLNLFKEHTKTITGIQFSTENSNLLYTSSNDGTVKVWDLRSPKCSSLEYKDVGTGKKQKSFSTFDISANNRLLAVGTDMFEGDAFILFWDLRKSSLMGGYWESHTDDITQVKFHPDNSNRMISGAQDGLINVFDLSQNCEDDALTDSLNTEYSVEKLKWLEKKNKYVISSIGQNAEVQFWYSDDAEPFLRYCKEDIANAIHGSDNDHVYVVDVHLVKSDFMILSGATHQNKNHLQGVKVENKTLKSILGFSTNPQIVRSSWFNPNTNLLLTGGEQGILNVWAMK